MRIVVQSTFPGRRRNSPRADTLCSDLSVAPVPTGLFVADEAGITVTVDGGHPIHVHALAAIGADGDFDDRVHLVAAVPGLGTIRRFGAVDLSGTVDAAITRCATDFAVGVAEAAIDLRVTGQLVVLDHCGDIRIDGTY
ncbi:hypothetical protein DEU38_12393 [Rhodococcus sp. AG1013]|uniref:hypothetical protein n=1 Tax=Rhodococcus sp. AG1013 TaxID=2183996 RepID=UPI000E0C99D8|nr:hypothetical protein [Rhodococcus sp. AG1013]RDI17257.1 hypothetical protein DEU38_12393 [Rhodococcus sp. AG1013]